VAHLFRHLSSLRLPVLIFGAVTVAWSVSAEPYPSRVIRIVAATPAGAPPDIVSRLIAHELAENEGWRVIVENKPGGLSTIGATDVLKHPADGYTIFTAALLASAVHALMPDLSFRYAAEFEPVIKVATAHHVLVVHPSVPAHSLSELVALLKTHPDKFNFSSGGFGTPAHLAGEMFKLRVGVRAIHVPYQALPRAIGDLLNGTNHYQFITPLPVVNLIASGKLRALAVTGPARVPALQGVPTVGEAGFPELLIQDWYGFLVKRGTPAEVIGRLNAAINKVLATPRVRETITTMAAEPAGGTPAEFGAFFAAQVAHWGKVVKEADIKVRH
jgi:tripartite-type tricarboxylate transporter receptor subunit TctC